MVVPLPSLWTARQEALPNPGLRLLREPCRPRERPPTHPLGLRKPIKFVRRTGSPKALEDLLASAQMTIVGRLARA